MAFEWFVLRSLVLLLTLTVFIRIYHIDKYLLAAPPPSANVNDFKLCKDVSSIWNCLNNGSWSLRDVVTQEHIQQRREMDSSILEYLDWPGILFRSDRRCGEAYKVPGSTLPALCDEYSDTPCCNEVTGLCGITAAHCNCSTCQDFRSFVPAELAEWRPHSEVCQMEEFSKESACRFLKQHVTNLVFVGDSLIRHLFAAFTVLVTNDPMKGAQNVKLKSEQLKHCEGEYQFIDQGKHVCHGTIAHNWDELNTSQVCDGKGTFKTYLVEAYHTVYVGQAVATAQTLLGQKGSIMVIGVGLHMHSNHRMVIDNYLTPILKITEKAPNGWPLIIWVTIPTVHNYLKSSVEKIEEPIRAFNTEMKAFCSQHNIPVMDTTDITKRIKSYDGRHFGFGGNMAKAQLLLNFLQQRVAKCGNLNW